MARSRLLSVKEKRELRQAIVLILITVALLVGFVFWGLPAVASFVGNNFIKKSDPETLKSLEIKPTSPILSDIPEATNSAKLAISGFAQPGVNVDLYINSELADSIAVNDSGTFVFPEVELSSGDNFVYAFAKSTTSELESDKSKEYMVVVDTTKPVITLTSPSNESVFHSERERVVTITGSVDEEGVRVMVGERLAIVSPDKTFNVSYQLVEGDQELSIKAVDRAGNENEEKLKLKWEK